MSLDYIIALEHLGLYKRNSHFSKIRSPIYGTGLNSEYFSDNSYLNSE